MAIRYIDNLPQRKDARYAVVSLEDLFLDEDNPRFASSTLLSRNSGISQKEIINYLVKYGEADKLANEIDRHNGLFGEDIMSACVIDGRVVVLEGNRRLAACKLLMDRSVLNDEIVAEYAIPQISEETRNNIQEIMLLIYNESADAQSYIASKHTQPNIKKWTTIEQYNYYYSQFKDGKTAAQISVAVGASGAQYVEKRIKEYALFISIFELVKKKYSSIEIEAASILPVITAFMPKLLGKNKKYSLTGVEYDPESLTYVALPSQQQKYEEILFLIGEAFFVRPDAKKQSEKLERTNSDKYRITSDEIKGSQKVETIIDKDIRIPGLKRLILDFCGEDPNKKQEGESLLQPSESQTNDGAEGLNGSEHFQNDFSQRGETSPDLSIDSTTEFHQKEKQTLFFADFRYEHLDPSKQDNKGLIAVAKEIKKLSASNNHSGYYSFPIAASFLLRSLIEQILLRLLKGTQTYAKLKNNTSKATPELEKMITEILKFCKNGNSQQVNLDIRNGNDFIACFEGGGTKNQLNKIIHSPAECQPNKEFLDSMANGGLKSLLQALIDSFT